MDVQCHNEPIRSIHCHDIIILDWHIGQYIEPINHQHQGWHQKPTRGYQNCHIN